MADGVWRGLPPISMEELRTILAEAPPEQQLVPFLGRVAAADERWHGRREALSRRIERWVDERPGPMGIASVLPQLFRSLEPRSGEALARDLATLRARHDVPHPFIDDCLRRGDAVVRLCELARSDRLPAGAFYRLVHLVNPFRPADAPTDPERVFPPLAVPGLVALRPWLVAEEPALWAVLQADFDRLAFGIDRRSA